MTIEVQRVTHEFFSVEAEDDKDGIAKVKAGIFASKRSGAEVFSVARNNAPSAATQAKNLMGAAGKAIRNPKPVSREEKERRLEICRSCEFLIEGKRCAKCGCTVKWKALLEAWHCPIQKW